MAGSDDSLLFASAPSPPWAEFRYAHADHQCPRCRSREHFRPPAEWYSLPPEKILIIRCGRCAIDTMTTAGALASNLEAAHLHRHGYVRKTVCTQRAYSAFVAGMAVGGAVAFVLAIL